MKKGQKFIASMTNNTTPTTTFEYVGVNHNAPNPYNVMLIDVDTSEKHLVSWAWFKDRYIKIVS